MDVHTAMNGKTIQVKNTDAEGRLVLADGLCYADTFKPKVVVDVATLTGCIVDALGCSSTGVYSNSNADWEVIHSAGKVTGDRVWRMPLWKHFSAAMCDADLADLCNVGSHDRKGGSCTAAAFLRNFTECKRWMHLDCAGVMTHDSPSLVPFMNQGASGRPTRTLSEFVISLSQH